MGASAERGRRGAAATSGAVLPATTVSSYKLNLKCVLVHSSLFTNKVFTGEVFTPGRIVGKLCACWCVKENFHHAPDLHHGLQLGRSMLQTYAAGICAGGDATISFCAC